MDIIKTNIIKLFVHPVKSQSFNNTTHSATIKLKNPFFIHTFVFAVNSLFLMFLKTILTFFTFLAQENKIFKKNINRAMNLESIFTPLRFGISYLFTPKTNKYEKISY